MEILHSLSPVQVACEGRCDELYCSEECSQLDWTEHHSLLCTGEASPSQQDPKYAVLVFLQAFKDCAIQAVDLMLVSVCMDALLSCLKSCVLESK